MHRSELRLVEILLEYDGPQVVLGKDFYGKYFICVAVPDEDNYELFLGARISDDNLEQLRAGRVDLRYALTAERGRKRKLVTFSYAGYEETVRIQPLEVEPAEEWLPESKLFLHDVVEMEAAEQSRVTVGIDGRWDIQDLESFPQALAGPYAFLYAVMRGAEGQFDRVRAMFQRYPWRGGFSTVNFYRDLYRAIPASDRVVVQKMEYASPGVFELSAEHNVINALHDEVESFSTTDSYEIYQELHREMSSRELLGRTLEEAFVDEGVEEFLHESCRQLARAIRFRHLNRLYRLSGNSWFQAAKLLLAHYRRLVDLAEFYRSGKAEYRGEIPPTEH